MENAETKIKRKQLEKNIQLLILQINSVRQDLYRLSDRVNYSQLQFQDLTKVSEKNSSLSKVQLNLNLELSFYDSFIKIVTDNERSFLAILIPVPRKESYGLRFIKNNSGTYKLASCYLPNSFNYTEEKEKNSAVNLDDIAKYVQEIQEEIYAFTIRQEQIDKFKKLSAKRIGLNQHLNCKYLSMKFSVFDKEENTRHIVKAELIYDKYRILPKSINLTINPEHNVLEEVLNSKFDTFQSTDLVTAYKDVFVDSKYFKYFY